MALRQSTGQCLLCRAQVSRITRQNIPRYQQLPKASFRSYGRIAPVVRNELPSRNYFLQARPRTISPQKPISPAFPRFQSTSTVSPDTSPLEGSLSNVQSSDTPSELANNTQELIGNAGASSEWYLGYIKDHGIDFGYGPTWVMQQLFEHVHVYSGGTIGGSIIISALIIRVIVFYFTNLPASDANARNRAFAPILEPLQKKMQAAYASGDTKAYVEAKQKWNQSRVAAGVSMLKMAAPLIQIPFGYGAWKLLRKMVSERVPGMDMGGTLWFQNLCVPDPFFVLPLALAGSTWLNSWLNIASGELKTPNPVVKNGLLYFLPVIVGGVTCWQSAAVQLSFATSAFFMLVTTNLLRAPWFRDMFRLFPLNTSVKTTAKAHYPGSMTLAPSAIPQTTQTKQTASPPPPPGSGRIRQQWQSAVNGTRTAIKKLNESAMFKKTNEAQKGKLKKQSMRKAEEYEQKRQKELREQYGSGK